MAGISDADGIDRPYHAPISFEKAIGNRNDSCIRLCRTRGTPDVPGNLHFITLGIEGAGGHIGSRSRAADAGKAMHHHGCLAIPCGHEIDKPLHMLMRRCREAIHRCGDVVDREHKMVFRRDMCRPLHPVDQPQQGNNVTCSGLVDRSVQA